MVRVLFIHSVPLGAAFFQSSVEKPGLSRRVHTAKFVGSNPTAATNYGHMNPTVIKVNPIWGATVKPGYCGFITREKDFVGDGIEYFERFESGLPFCHAFAISDRFVAVRDAGLIEAHARLGVHRAQLSEYFNDPTCQCFIRIPRGFADNLRQSGASELGMRIVAGMEAQLGDKYGYGLIVADLLANTFAGHLLNKCTGNLPDRIVCRLLGNQHTRICSEAVAYALQSALKLNSAANRAWPTGNAPAFISEMELPGCLKQPADTIDPRLLGNDPEIWEPIIYRVS